MNHSPSAVTTVTGHRKHDLQPAASYAALKKLLKQRGLLEKQPVFLTRKMLINLGLLAFSVVTLFVLNSLWF